MSGQPPPIVGVRGGAGGTEAHLEDLQSLAGVFDRAGDVYRDQGLEIGKVMVDGDLLASAVLSPGTFAVVETDVGRVTAQLELRALGAEADAVILRVTVSAYHLGDQAVTALFDLTEYAAGFALGAALPFLAIGGGLTALALLGSNPVLLAYLATHPEVVSQLEAGAGTELQKLVQDHPDLVEFLVGGGGGLVDGLLTDARLLPGGALVLAALGIDPLHPTTSAAAAELARLYTDGDPATSTPQVDDLAPGPPTDVQDLLSGMQYTNGRPTGTVSIQTLTSTGPDGQPVVRYVVDIPGTKSWALPGSQDGTAPDLGSNLRLVGGENTVYARGIAQAMQEAGVPPGAHVMLVGHSQGGMTAAALATDPSFGYQVDHVVTAGSPIAHHDFSSGTQVLSLENKGDVVPRLDGAPNDDQPNHTTVTFNEPTGTLGGNHDMQRYVDGGAAVDASQDPALVGVRDQLRQDGYLGATSSTTTDVVVSRKQ